MRRIRLTNRMQPSRDDRGAVLIVVAVFALVAIVMLAAVVDLGGLRQQKKEVTLSTDAAALAVAGEAQLSGLGVGTYDCSAVPTETAGVYADTVAQAFLTKNGETAFLQCRVVVTDSNRGYVLVGGNKDVDFNFGPAIGQNSGAVNGVSAAAIRTDLGGGLRPLGLCSVESTLNVNPADGQPFSIKDDVINGATGADGSLVTPVDAVVQMEHLKKDQGNCKLTDLASGNRGQLDLGNNGGGNGGQCKNAAPGEGNFSSDVAYGYFGDVPQNTDQDPGTDFNSVTECLSALAAAGQHFWLPAYDSYDKRSKTFHITHFVEGSLTGYCLQNGNSQYPAVLPAGLACKLPTEDEPKKGAEWFRLTLYRAVPWKFGGPDPTLDAADEPPTLCAERDDATLLQVCESISNPSDGSSGSVDVPDPPPAKCETATAPTSASGKLKKNTTNLNSAVTFTITVKDFSACAGLTFDLVRTTDSVSHSFDSTSSKESKSTYSASVSTGPFHGGRDIQGHH